MYLALLPRSCGQVIVTFSSRPAQLTASAPANLTFALTDTRGQPVTFNQLSVVKDRRMHIVLAGEDLDVIGHQHPEDYGVTTAALTSGQYVIHFTFPKAGKYYVGLDFEVNGTAYDPQVVIQVDGAPRMIPFLPSPPLVGASASFIPVAAGPNDSYDQPVTFSSIQTNEVNSSAFTYTIRPVTFVANICTPVTIEVRHLGVPVTTLRPYLGAAMHLYVVSNMGVDHVHGTSLNTSGGMMEDACSMQTMMTMIPAEEPAQFGPFVYASVTFKEAGVRPLMGTGALGQSLLYFRGFVNVSSSVQSLAPRSPPPSSKATMGYGLYTNGLLVMGLMLLGCNSF